LLVGFFEDLTVAGHVVPKKLYFNVFGLLMILTLVTTLVAFADLGPFNTIVALTIAVGKAIVVTLFFMHVRYSSRLTWIVVGAGLFWLAIMIFLTLTDYLTRGWA
jgi:cytochrome c oxidase subunit IV